MEFLERLENIQGIDLPLKPYMEVGIVNPYKVGDDVGGYRIKHISLVGMTSSSERITGWFEPGQAALRQDCANYGCDYFTNPIVMAYGESKKAMVSYGLERIT